jgi:hypothetical protein
MFVPSQKSVKATTKHKSENGEMIKWLKNLLNKSIFATNQMGCQVFTMAANKPSLTY